MAFSASITLRRAGAGSCIKALAAFTNCGLCWVFIECSKDAVGVGFRHRFASGQDVGDIVGVLGQDRQFHVGDFGQGLGGFLLHLAGGVDAGLHLLLGGAFRVQRRDALTPQGSADQVFQLGHVRRGEEAVFHSKLRQGVDLPAGGAEDGAEPAHHRRAALGLAGRVFLGECGRDAVLAEERLEWVGVVGLRARRLAAGRALAAGLAEGFVDWLRSDPLFRGVNGLR